MCHSIVKSTSFDTWNCIKTYDTMNQSNHLRVGRSLFVCETDLWLTYIEYFWRLGRVLVFTVFVIGFDVISSINEVDLTIEWHVDTYTQY